MSKIDRDAIVVNAQQMQQIEAQVFEAGMPVAALMEKAAFLSAGRLMQLYNLKNYPLVGVLVGPGHNGGDALVIARELYLAGYGVIVYQPLSKSKELTAQHRQYAEKIGILFAEGLEMLSNCQLILDGLFGFGLSREITDDLAKVVEQINHWTIPVVSLDLPSGIHTDTGAVLGTAIKACRTFCLGLWKRAFFQDCALEYLGTVERIDWGVTTTAIDAVLSKPSVLQMTPQLARQCLPIPRAPVTHKYKQGHLLIVCGSHRYAGGTVLTGLGARASGVGMVTIAVPHSLKPILVSHLSEALVVGCEETDSGAIANLPDAVQDWSQFNTIACGPGLTPEATPIVEAVLEAECPLILDADGLNILAQLDPLKALSRRSAATVLTPHLGEFRRLFPKIETGDWAKPSTASGDRLAAAQTAAQQSGAFVLLKGSRTVVADPHGGLYLIGNSTPALARGGTGDVLTGLAAGLVAQNQNNLAATVATAAWWHAQAGIMAAKERTELGVDAHTLTRYLIPAIQSD